MMTTDLEFKSEFAAGMRKAASSVCVVTTEGPSGRFGVTVSSMTSVSMEPPSILVCVNKDNFVASAVLGNRVFCVNMLREDQSSISDLFAGRQGSEINRFECGRWTESQTKCPALLGAATVFDCSLAESHLFGSHVVLIGKVVSVVNHPTSLALVYHDRKYCTITPSIRHGSP